MSQSLCLHTEKHLQFIRSLDARINRLDYWQTEHLRMSGIYWALTALLLLKPDLSPAQQEEAFNEASPLTRAQIINFVASCQRSAIQILCILDAIKDERFTWPLHLQWITSLQHPNGSFSGDEGGEIDTRFTFCALACVDLLKRAHISCSNITGINQETALSYVGQCRNADGGYGAVPGGESHAGQIFCCVGTRAIVGDVEELADQEKSYPFRPDNADDQLSGWLAWRQLSEVGGLNGRPQKLEDVCYSWWVVSSLAMLKRLSWIDSQALQAFILRCQDEDDGGIADRPGDASDIFHTLFGIAGLALTGYPGLAPVDARFCMPTRFVLEY